MWVDGFIYLNSFVVVVGIVFLCMYGSIYVLKFMTRFCIRGLPAISGYVAKSVRSRVRE